MINISFNQAPSGGQKKKKKNQISSDKLISECKSHTIVHSPAMF